MKNYYSLFSLIFFLLVVMKRSSKMKKVF